MAKLIVIVVASFFNLISTYPAAAQQAGKVYRIGYIGPDRVNPAFRQGLSELGYVEGRNLAFDQYANVVRMIGDRHRVAGVEGLKPGSVLHYLESSAKDASRQARLFEQVRLHVAASPARTGDRRRVLGPEYDEELGG